MSTENEAGRTERCAFDSTKEPELLQRLERGSEDKHPRVRHLVELWDEDDACANLKRTTWTFSQPLTARLAGGTLAVSVAVGMIFTVDEEGRWRCAFQYNLNRPISFAVWTINFTFSTTCRTELVTLDGWQFVAGKGTTQTTQMPWDPRGDRSALIRLPWDEFFPVMTANDESVHSEVRTGVSPGLRRDFDRLHFARRRIDGLFSLGSV
jgi:hypothetical protein